MPNPFIAVAKLLLPFLHKLLVTIFSHPIGRIAATESVTRAVARSYTNIRAAQPGSATPGEPLSTTIQTELKRAQTKSVSQARSQPRFLPQWLWRRWHQNHPTTVDQVALRSRVRWRLLTLATFVQFGLLWYFPIKDPWDAYEEEPYTPDPSLFDTVTEEPSKPKIQLIWTQGLAQWIRGLSSWTYNLSPWVQSLSPQTQSVSTWAQEVAWRQYSNPLENGWMNCRKALKADKLLEEPSRERSRTDGWRVERRRKVDQMRRVWRELLQIC